MSLLPLSVDVQQLPPPSPEALAHQEKLLRYIKERCKAQGGWLPFNDFMQAALYAPGLGYYSAGMHKFGPTGDFTTAPEISPLFSQCLAHQCGEILQQLSSQECCILELGAGTGKMAGEIIRSLADQQIKLKHYYILEVSGDLKTRQQAYLRAQCPEFFDKFQWLDQLPSTPFTGIILGNEVIDAMPVHLFKIAEKNEVLEGFIGYQDQWTLKFKAASKPLAAAVNALQQHLPVPLSIGYISEINLLLDQWIKSLATCLAQGAMLFIDYGFPRAEYYHPQRTMGTLMCHYRHHAHPDFLKWIGLQDITAHVDFTAVAIAAHQADLAVLGFTHQAAFLLGNHLLALAQASADQQLQWRYAQQIQRLTQVHEMGELFKVIALGKNFTADLQGFSISNQLHRL